MAERVLFVHARAADETVLTGGTIAELAGRGAAVTVLTMTGGSDLDPFIAAAVRALGVTDHRTVRETDSSWATAIAEVILDVDPHVVVSCAIDSRDERSDHARGHRATRRAAHAMGVPFYAVADSAPADVTVDDTVALELKRTALAEYAAPLSLVGLESVVIAPERLRRVRPQSAFAAQTRVARVASLMFAAALGALTGVIMTVAHQANAEVAGVAVPWGVAAALVIAACLCVGLRLLSGARVVAAAAGGALLLTVGLLAGRSSGGSVLIPDNPVGYIFVIGTAVLVVGAVLWGRPRRRAR